MTQTSKNTGAETMPICNKLKRERLACHNGFTVTIAFITHNGAASPEGDETPLPLSPSPPTLEPHRHLPRTCSQEYTFLLHYSFSYENDLQFRNRGERDRELRAGREGESNCKRK